MLSERSVVRLIRITSNNLFDLYITKVWHILLKWSLYYFCSRLSSGDCDRQLGRNVAVCNWTMFIFIWWCNFWKLIMCSWRSALWKCHLCILYYKYTGAFYAIKNTLQCKRSVIFGASMQFYQLYSNATKGKLMLRFWNKRSTRIGKINKIYGYVNHKCVQR